MSAISVAIKIWAKTVILVIIGITIFGLVVKEFYVIFYAFLAVIFGGFITSPLLLIIWPLVKLSACLPYNNQARMMWLTFVLFCLYALIFILGVSVTNDHSIIRSAEVSQMLAIIIGVQLIAVITTRKSLYKFYEPIYS